MRMCSDGHEEVVYEGSSCPACEAIRDKEKAEEEVTDLEDQLSVMRADLRDRDKDIERLECKITNLEDEYVDRQSE